MSFFVILTHLVEVRVIINTVMQKYIKWAVVLALVFAGAGYLYASLFHQESFVSRAQLIVLAPKTSNQPKDYASIATSYSSLEWVKGDLGLDDSVDDLRGYISATNVAGTNLIALSVVTDDAKKSQRIASSLTTSVGSQAKILFGENNTSVVDVASDGVSTGEANPARAALMAGLAGLLVVGAVAFVFFDPKKDKVSAKLDKGEDAPGGGSDADELVPANKGSSGAVDIKPVGYKYNYTYSRSGVDRRMSSTKSADKK